MDCVPSSAVVEGVHELSHAAMVDSRKDVTSMEELTEQELSLFSQSCVEVLQIR
jgi:hypothetical protein